MEETFKAKRFPLVVPKEDEVRNASGRKDPETKARREATNTRGAREVWANDTTKPPPHWQSSSVKAPDCPPPAPYSSRGRSAGGGGGHAANPTGTPVPGDSARKAGTDAGGPRPTPRLAPDGRRLEAASGSAEAPGRQPPRTDLLGSEPTVETTGIFDAEYVVLPPEKRCARRDGALWAGKAPGTGRWGAHAPQTTARARGPSTARRKATRRPPGAAPCGTPGPPGTSISCLTFRGQKPHSGLPWPLWETGWGQRPWPRTRLRLGHPQPLRRGPGSPLRFTRPVALPLLAQDGSRTKVPLQFCVRVQVPRKWENDPKSGTEFSHNKSGTLSVTHTTPRGKPRGAAPALTVRGARLGRAETRRGRRRLREGAADF